MAPMRGNKKNKDIVRELEPLVQEAHKIVNEESQTLKDVEIEVLRKEVEILTKVLRNQQLHNRGEEFDLDDGFENPFAKPNHWQQGGENHRVRATHLGSRRVGEPFGHRSTILEPLYLQDLREPHLIFHQEGDHERGLEQPPVYDIEVEDEIGDDQEEGITWEAFPSVISVLLVMSISFGCLSAETSSRM
uniref:Uncharacterized protein n=1 Tax=Fagus sylvatica TaxID=28930 RepID=A0A2N9HNR8_FAGSY